MSTDAESSEQTGVGAAAGNATSADTTAAHTTASDDPVAAIKGEPSTEFLERTAAAGWPEALARRIHDLSADSAMVDQWIESGFPNAEMLEVWADDQERLMYGTLRIRNGTWADNEIIADLYANSAEKVGPWNVTVEHEPFASAHLRLQEESSIALLEDRRVGLGCMTRSLRNTYIAGEPTTVHFMGGWRVRNGFRGQGYSRMLQWAAGPSTSKFGLLSYWYVREGNAGGDWVARVVDDMESRPDEFGAEAQGLTATVHHVPAGNRLTAAPSDITIRAAEPADLPRCSELVAGTNVGLDLFAPPSPERLAERLDDPSWGQKPPFWEAVYEWGDYHVAERDGRIVACGGLWDRGRHMRERWEHRETGENFVIQSTALLDHGYEPDAVDAMAALLDRFSIDTATLGYDTLMVAIEHEAELQRQLAELELRPETRTLNVLPFGMPGLSIDLQVTRPHTDLAYW